MNKSGLSTDFVIHPNNLTFGPNPDSSPLSHPNLTGLSHTHLKSPEVDQVFYSYPSHLPQTTHPSKFHPPPTGSLGTLLLNNEILELQHHHQIVPVYPRVNGNPHFPQQPPPLQAPWAHSHSASEGEGVCPPSDSETHTTYLILDLCPTNPEKLKPLSTGNIEYLGFVFYFKNLYCLILHSL